MTTPRRFVPIAAAVLLVAAGLVPMAHAAEEQAIGWILTRVGSAAEPIEGNLAASAVSDESSVFMFAASGRGASRRVDYRFTTTTASWGGDQWVRVNQDPVPSVPCPAACDSPVGWQWTIPVTSNNRALSSTVYVAAFHVRFTTLTITSPGWKVHRWTPTWQQLTTSNSRGSTMVTAEHEAVGTYRGGEITGGRYGSVASVGLPCDMYGLGDMTLTGGTRARHMTCTGASGTVDGWPKRTTWRLTGAITGAGAGTDVLIVVDYPR
ncbi:MAG: hypothetical protein QOD07_2405 [Frankiaceae bacterium]|jgi:hypothetical protein|nr:hypothetical protein [Frankiaceae bacterium]